MNANEHHPLSWNRFPARYQDFLVNELPLLDPGPLNRRGLWLEILEPECVAPQLVLETGQFTGKRPQ